MIRRRRRTPSPARLPIATLTAGKLLVVMPITHSETTWVTRVETARTHLLVDTRRIVLSTGKITVTFTITATATATAMTAVKMRMPMTKVAGAMTDGIGRARPRPRRRPRRRLGEKGSPAPMPTRKCHDTASRTKLQLSKSNLATALVIWSRTLDHTISNTAALDTQSFYFFSIASHVKRITKTQALTLHFAKTVHFFQMKHTFPPRFHINLCAITFASKFWSLSYNVQLGLC